MRNVLRQALINALGTALYIAFIASALYLTERSSLPITETVFVPIAMLMLFVFSAAFTGFLVFGRPLMWYIDGNKREAISLLLYTLGILLLIILLMFALVISV